MNTFILIMVLCSNDTGRCDSYIIDSDLSISDCNQYRIETLIAHKGREEEGKYASYVQSMSCVVEDKE